MINKKDLIFLAGHNGMVGSSILKLLHKKKFKNILTINKSNLDLLDQKKVFSFLQKKRPKSVIIAAAKVGGIGANNSFKSEFLYNNLQIQNNLIHGSYISGVKNLIFLGSSCIYPNHLLRPIKEEDILNGPLENTNDAYAISKIAGLKMCQFYSKNYNLNYKTLMPTNLFGPNDNYDLKTSHFFPALIKKIVNAKLHNKREIFLWGNGKALREMLYVDDLADATLYFLSKKIKYSHINIGSGYEKSILEYAKIIMNYFKIKLKVKFDKSKPNGTFRKKLDIKKATTLGWKSKVNFQSGLDKTIKDYLDNSNIL